MKVHLLDASQSNGVACNNSRARGEVTADITQVTCVRCLPDEHKGRRGRRAGQPPWNPGNQAPPGPSLGD